MLGAGGGGASETAAAGSLGAWGGGEYSVRNAKSTAKDKTNARMTRFSIYEIPGFLSHGIESPAMQRMTSEQPRSRPHETPNQTILLNRLRSVFRTSRGEATGRWQPGRDNKLIRAYGRQCESLCDTCSHFSAPRRSTSSSRNRSNSRSFTDPRGFTTKSNPVGINIPDARIISLILLLARFRSCAWPSLRGVVIPKRL